MIHRNARRNRELALNEKTLTRAMTAQRDHKIRKAIARYQAFYGG